MNGKKIVTLVIVALVLFFLIAQPNQAANAVTNILDWLKSAADAVITFVRNVFS